MNLLDELIEYSEDVVGGKIIACQKHIWSCERFLYDLDRQGFAYIFDEAKATRFLDWMRLFKHTKGTLQGTQIEPHIIQKFIFGNIYGWVHKDTDIRRFKKAYWQVGRKNAKSQSLAVAATYENMALGESMAEVYCAATKASRSKIVWKEAEAQLKQCEILKGKYKVAYGEIKHTKSGSIIAALSKDDGKTGDGLNPQAGIIDEYHAHPTSEIYDVLVSGMGARRQPLLIVITTAGFELAYPCYQQEYLYVTKILDPSNSAVENEEYFVMINELDTGDDIKDEQNWLKANPIICSYPSGVEYLRGELSAALSVPEKMRSYLTKNMNIWVDQKENGYMQMAKWAACKTEMPDLRGLECLVGVDLSSKIDLTSVSFEFILSDDRYAILSHSFAPEERIAEKRKTDKMPYDLWIQKKHITATPGSVIDYRFVGTYIKEQARLNDWTIKEICFDPYNATQFANELSDEGYTCVDIRQGMATLSEPTKSFREKVYEGKLIHDGNPVLTWAVGNAVVKMDAQENIMLDKKKSTERIDPIASAINAHVRAIAYRETEKSVYEEHGILIL